MSLDIVLRDVSQKVRDAYALASFHGTPRVNGHIVRVTNDRFTVQDHSPVAGGNQVTLSRDGQWELHRAGAAKPAASLTDEDINDTHRILTSFLRGYK